MNIRKVLLLLSVNIFAIGAFSQTNPNVIQVDSAMANPDARRTAPLDVTDTVSNLRAATPVQQEAPVVKDSARLALERLPRQAVIRSAIIPGWGQIKNGRWWKVPFIYGGFVGLGFAIEWNNRYYHMMLDEIRYYQIHKEFAPDSPFYGRTGVNDQSLVPYKDYYRRNRDLSILGVGAMYAINLIDAYIDAKFFRFDVSDDLSLKVSPSFLQPSLSHAYHTPVPALKIKLSL